MAPRLPKRLQFSTVFLRPDGELGPKPSAGIGRIGVALWRQACASGGEAALAAKSVPGRPRQLTDQQGQQWLQLLLKGARAYGFPNEFWTLKRMATVIWLECRVRHHPSHVWKVLRSWPGSCQVPERRAIQRDEPVMAHWTRDQWPAIKKPEDLAPILSLLGESHLSVQNDPSDRVVFWHTFVVMIYSNHTV
jgi:transposase